MTLRSFDLNLAPALCALLEERNVTRAAERLSMGQPAMSAALARLRRHFDDPLLVRDGREYRLSTFAESLLEPVRAAMTALDFTAIGRQAFNPAMDARSFTIATSDYVALVFLRPLLAGLAHEAPQVRLRLVPITLGMGDALRRGALDLVLLPMELANELHGLPRKALFEDRFVLAADRANPALAGITSLDGPDRTDAATPDAAIDLDLMSRLPFVAVSGEMPSLVEVRLREHGITLRVDVTTEAFVIAPMLLKRHAAGEPGAGTPRPARGRSGEPAASTAPPSTSAASSRPCTGARATPTTSPTAGSGPASSPRPRRSDVAQQVRLLRPRQRGALLQVVQERLNLLRAGLTLGSRRRNRGCGGGDAQGGHHLVHRRGDEEVQEAGLVAGHHKPVRRALRHPHELAGVRDRGGITQLQLHLAPRGYKTPRRCGRACEAVARCGQA